jgi:hypothetical protein
MAVDRQADGRPLFFCALPEAMRVMARRIFDRQPVQALGNEETAGIPLGFDQ